MTLKTGKPFSFDHPLKYDVKSNVCCVLVWMILSWIILEQERLIPLCSPVEETEAQEARIWTQMF